MRPASAVPRERSEQHEAFVMNRFIYHYHAHYQSSRGAMTHLDGIALLGNRIVDMDGYKTLKKLVSPENDGEVTIAGLTLLGRENDS